MLCLFFLLPASIKEAWAMHPILPLVLNVLNAIFWFVGGVATAAYLWKRSQVKDSRVPPPMDIGARAREKRQERLT